MTGSLSFRFFAQGEDSWGCHRCGTDGVIVTTLQFNVL